MMLTRLSLAGAAAAAALCGAWTAAEAHEMAPSHAMSLPAGARRDAIHHLRAAMHELDRPARAQNSLAAAESALANGAEARGSSPRPGRSPFAETIAACRVIQHGGSRREDHVAIARAIRAVEEAR